MNQQTVVSTAVSTFVLAPGQIAGIAGFEVGGLYEEVQNLTPAEVARYLAGQEIELRRPDGSVVGKLRLQDA